MDGKIEHDLNQNLTFSVSRAPGNIPSAAKLRLSSMSSCSPSIICWSYGPAPQICIVWKKEEFSYLIYQCNQTEFLIQQKETTSVFR